MAPPAVFMRSLLLLAFVLCVSLHAPLAHAQEEGVLMVKTVPANARVRLLYVKPKFVQGIKLPPGNYMIDVQADGYETAFKELSITAGKTTSVEVALNPLPGTAPPQTSAQASAQAETSKATQEPASTSEEQPAQEPAGQLFVETTPADAVIRILSIKPKFKQGIDLAPGTYRISITKPGFAPQELPAEIKPREKTTLKVQLKKEDEASKELPLDRKGFGRLYVDVTPDDATVRVLRIKPVFDQGIELKADKYTIDVQKDGYEKQVLRVDIKDREATRLNVTLVPSNAEQDTSDAATGLTEQPEQAQQTQQAQQATTSEQAAAPDTPADKADSTPVVSPPAEATVVSTTNQTGARDAIAPGHGKLLLNMTPSDVEATIAELEIKYQHGMALPVGNYTIHFLKEGYADHSVRASIQDGQALTLDVTLQPENAPAASSFSKIKEVDVQDLKGNTGKLFLETSPSDATVMVLNIKPKFEQGMELKAGSYRLDIRRDGYEPMRVVVAITQRKAVTYRVVLQPAAEQPPAPAARENGSAPVPAQQAEQAKAHLQDGRALLEDGNEQGAVDALTKAIALDPSLVEAMVLRAAVYARLKQFETALEDYTRAIKLANRSPHPYLERARLNEALGRPEAACYDYWMACSLDACDGIRDAQKRGLCQ